MDRISSDDCRDCRPPPAATGPPRLLQAQ